ncbi:MAG: hypothetical protein C0518_13800 [Opitutus sp.]|nr:hypothetical protein [Opitutus sp.]
MNRSTLLVLMCAGLFGATSLHAQTVASDADLAAIRATALDYIEGYYTADPERVEKAIFTDIAKRIPMRGPQGRTRVERMSSLELINHAKSGDGKKIPVEQQLKEVKILDVFENIASIRVDAASWVDHMQLAKLGDRWVVVNVLWQLKPRPAPAG